MASAAQRRIKSISYAKYGYYFILPFFVVYFFFQLWPLINTFILAFQENISSGTEVNYVGFDNFKVLLFGSDRRPERMAHESFMTALGNTFILWIGNFIPQIILSLSLAVWFTDAKLKIPGKGFFKIVMYLPNIITAASVSVLFLQLCGQSTDAPGAVNSILQSIGALDKGEVIEFVEGTWESRGTVMFIQTWMWFGNTMIMLMSGIMGINPSLFEAASIDGANGGQVFRKITLPLLSPIMAYTLVTSMIGGLQMFDIPYLYHKDPNKVNEDLETVAVYIYQLFHPSNGGKVQYGYSGAASVLLFLITLALGLIAFYMTRDKDEIAKKKQRKAAAKQFKLEQSKKMGGLSI
ncbi:MAG: sugar ABC transporter permease [Ruminococcus sp.]|nr:sugar ABC transporter permease [Ruminococcus sp.]